jgi:hypothetical protein
VEINYQGKTVEAQMVDSCPGCGANDLGRFSCQRISCPGLMGCSPEDMSPATFEKLAPLSEGVIQIEWHFMRR